MSAADERARHARREHFLADIRRVGVFPSELHLDVAAMAERAYQAGRRSLTRSGGRNLTRQPSPRMPVHKPTQLVSTR